MKLLEAVSGADEGNYLFYIASCRLGKRRELIAAAPVISAPRLLGWIRRSTMTGFTKPPASARGGSPFSRTFHGSFFRSRREVLTLPSVDPNATHQNRANSVFRQRYCDPRQPCNQAREGNGLAIGDAEPPPIAVVSDNQHAMTTTFGLEVILRELGSQCVFEIARGPIFVAMLDFNRHFARAEVEATITSGLSPVATSASRNAWKRPRAPPVRSGGGIPQRIMANSRPVSVLRTTGSG